MNAQVHRCKVAVMTRLKPYTVLILSPNSEKWIGIVYKVKGLLFIDLLEFILFFFMSLLLYLWHTQTQKLLSFLQNMLTSVSWVQSDLLVLLI